ncbi:MAG TPA: VOC family protein [Candidatus Binataceae bacterium]|nr:VOC family protein [Candidatus Binataceae bacterium]
MTTPSIARLGHVGIHVNDLEREKAFYRDIVGLQISDEDARAGMVFMSSRPDEEHHEFLLCRGRNVGADSRLLQQVSFRCNSLDDLIGYHRRLSENAVKIDMVVSHGNAIGIYFYDPEGNRCEIYWGTGLKARQPYLEKVDLTRPASEIMKDVEESVRQHGATGFVDMSAMGAQNLDASRRQ